MNEITSVVEMGLWSYFAGRLVVSFVLFIFGVYLLCILIKNIRTKDGWFRDLINRKIAKGNKKIYIFWWIIVTVIALLCIAGSFFYPVLLYKLLQVDPYQIIEDTNFIIQHPDS